MLFFQRKANLKIFNGIIKVCKAKEFLWAIKFLQSIGNKKMMIKNLIKSKILIKVIILKEKKNYYKI